MYYNGTKISKVKFSYLKQPLTVAPFWIIKKEYIYMKEDFSMMVSQVPTGRLVRQNSGVCYVQFLPGELYA